MKTTTEMRLKLINAGIARPRCPGTYFGLFGNEFGTSPATFKMNDNGIVTDIRFFGGLTDDSATHFDDTGCVWWAIIEDAELVEKTEYRG